MSQEIPSKHPDLIVDFYQYSQARRRTTFDIIAGLRKLVPTATAFIALVQDARQERFIGQRLPGENDHIDRIQFDLLLTECGIDTPRTLLGFQIAAGFFPFAALTDQLAPNIPSFSKLLQATDLTSLELPSQEDKNDISIIFVLKGFQMFPDMIPVAGPELMYHAALQLATLNGIDPKSSDFQIMLAKDGFNNPGSTQILTALEELYITQHPEESNLLSATDPWSTTPPFQFS